MTSKYSVSPNEICRFNVGDKVFWFQLIPKPINSIAFKPRDIIIRSDTIKEIDSDHRFVKLNDIDEWICVNVLSRFREVIIDSMHDRIQYLGEMDEQI